MILQSTCLAACWVAKRLEQVCTGSKPARTGLRIATRYVHAVPRECTLPAPVGYPLSMRIGCTLIHSNPSICSSMEGALTDVRTTCHSNWGSLPLLRNGSAFAEPFEVEFLDTLCKAEKHAALPFTSGNSVPKRWLLSTQGGAHNSLSQHPMCRAVPKALSCTCNCARRQYACMQPLRCRRAQHGYLR